MKHNRKTLKKKSLLKKRKGGKTARRRSRRMKGGIPDMGIMRFIGLKTKEVEINDERTCPRESKKNCCVKESPCPSDTDHYWLQARPELKGRKDLTFDIMGRRFTYEQVSAGRGENFFYCAKCQKIRCD
jgi:hypothetical protein